MKKECQVVEYKRIWKSEYLAWISGYANAHGGILHIGIDDDKTVYGLENAEKLMEDLPNTIRDVLGLVVDIDLDERDGKEIIVITVEPSSVPISYHGKYYYRSGSTNQELKGAALQEFILKKMGKQWDDLVCEGATMKDIDPAAIKYFLESAIEAERLNPKAKNTPAKTVLENYRLITEDGQLKNAAILLFGKDPGKFFTGIQFKIGRFGKGYSDLIFQDKIEGNILQMADRILEVLKSKYLTSPIYYKGMRRMEPLEIPEKGLREILYNSICHKLYSGVPIQMRVFDDYLEIWNEGELPNGYTVDTLLAKHSSKPRNLHIAEVFNVAGFIEAWGRGYEIIHDSFAEVSLPMPEIEASQGGVWVRVKRRNPFTTTSGNVVKDVVKDVVKVQLELSKRQKDIIRLIEKDARISADEMSQRLSVTPRTIQRDISILQKNGVIFREGSRFSGRWVIVKIPSK